MSDSNKTLYAEIERRTLLELLEAAKAYYENPENLKAYEEWRNSDEGKAYIREYV